MNQGQLGLVLGHIKRIVAAPSAAEQTDKQLLQRFADQHDEVAFATLVQRHGALVYGVCWRVLRHLQDAEDAFQASFLVLARKAGSISWRQSVSNWLYEVAYRLASEIKRKTARRQVHERQAAEMRTRNPPVDSGDLALVIDEELQRLPTRYRVPLLLCYLEGKTTDQAAKHLGWSLRTLQRRLEQGRELLRRRLSRQGYTLSAALLAAELVRTSAQAVFPPTLTDATVKGAMLVSAGKAAALGFSPQVQSLLQGANQALSWTKLKFGAAVLCLSSALAGTGFIADHFAASKPNQTAKGNTLLAQRPEQPPTLSAPEKRHPKIKPAELPWFQDRTAESGINFTYRNGQEADHYALLETLGGGVALIDYDQDGLLDIFVTGGGYFAGPDKKQIKGHPCRLYKNLGNFKFKNVTAEVGLNVPWFYTHGCAVADYDNDGWPDLLVTGYGRLALFHNEPDGKGGRHFVDVTQKAGLNDTSWSTSAAWADFSGSGFPDLYVCHYVDWSFENNPVGFGPTGKRDYCPPKRFNALPHILYKNNRDGTFTDVSKEAGILSERALKNGKGLGVVVVDVDDDGKPDIYVADDEVDKLLYLNQGKLQFKEVGEQAGVARDDNGSPNGSNGVDAADYNGSGRLSLFVTNSEHEAHGLYRNVGHNQFVFSSRSAGLASIGLKYVGFGTGFIDFDRDGAEDIFITNGHILRHPSEPDWLLQPPVLLRNLGQPEDKPHDVRFEDVSAKAGPFFQTRHQGRGAAFGDLDNDGRTDIVISHVNEPVVLLRNTLNNGNHWLGIELIGKPYRDAVGAKLTLEVGDRTLLRVIKGGGSYLSSSDRRVIFGLGKADKVGRLTVTWPSGQPRTQSWDNLKIDRYHRLIQK